MGDKLYLMRYLVLLLLVFSVSAEEYSLLGRIKNFISTGANNSLIEDSSLFGIDRVGGSKRLYTESTETNIHSHYRKNKASRFKNYKYTGRMRILDSDGGIGVTFYSDYPRSDTYYRIRMYSGNQFFHVAPHPDNAYTLSGTCNSTVSPQVGDWIRFRVVIKNRKSLTRIRAKLWPDGTNTPSSWQIDCSDVGANKLKRGKPGVWSMGNGRKEWANLKVVTPES